VATPYYLSLADLSDPADPVGRQILPDPAERCRRGAEEEDPLREEGRSPMPGIVHRYPDRVLLVATNDCAAYCRHCMRRRNWGSAGGTLSDDDLDRAAGYIRSDPAIRDAIVTGGDPLTLPDGAVDGILSRLRAIPHLQTVRIGTRVPVTLPMRVDRGLLSVLRRRAPVWIVTQFNHPREITEEAGRACARLLRAGCPVANQAVLLRGVNDDEGTLEALFRGLLAIGVRPYYLHQCDLVAGAGHFRTPLSRGVEILDSLRGRLPGLAIPHFVVDLPGGAGKVPLQPGYLLSSRDGRALFRSPLGGTVEYPDLPAEAAPFPRPLPPGEAGKPRSLPTSPLPSPADGPDNGRRRNSE
jgi:lysine 2,3-aminomutase